MRAGKGHKARVTYVGAGGCDALAAWLHVRGSNPGALFWPVAKGGVLAARRLTPAAIYRALAKRGRQAGVKSFSPHDLRRSFVSDLLDAGGDLSTVQKLAGHANSATTTRL